MTLFGSFSIEQIWNSECEHSDIIGLANSITVTRPAVAFLSLFWERVDPVQWVDNFYSLVKEIKQISPHTKIELVLDSVYQPWADLIKLDNIEHVTFIDFFALSLWHRVVELKHCVPCKTWNHSNNNFLFLTGKPDKVNRIRLLYKFYQQQLLGRCTWSLFHNNHYKEQCKKLLSELTNKEYNEFVDQHICNPDSIAIINNPNGSLHYGGTPFDTTIYQNCTFQVVSETLFANELNFPVWITEKTWLAILNHRPFIIAGESGILKKLKQLGFRTFDQYLLVDDYDNIIDNERRLDTIVKNTKHWLNNISNSSTQIQQDVDYNFQQFQQLVEQNQKKITERIIAYNIDCDISDVVLLIDIHQHAQWQNWYDRIRDVSWPDCPSEQDFWALPESVRTECIEVFGYKPKEKV